LKVVAFFSILAVALSANFSASAQTTNPDMDKLKPLSGTDFDIAFMKAMIKHHRAAIDMAKSAATNANHNEIKQAAANVISSQQKEIDDLTSWLKDWYNQQPDPDMSSMADIEAKAKQLTTLKGDDYDKQFIMDMIPHHQMAVDMAKLAADRATRSELKTTAQTIISAQSQEIDQLTGWMNQWYGLNAQGQPLVSTAGGSASNTTTNPNTTSTTPALPATGNPDNTTPMLLLVATLILIGGLLTRWQSLRPRA
jgi:uncharacterized protein (DUF305 family)